MPSFMPNPAFWEDQNQPKLPPVILPPFPLAHPTPNTHPGATPSYGFEPPPRQPTLSTLQPSALESMLETGWTALTGGFPGAEALPFLSTTSKLPGSWGSRGRIPGTPYFSKLHRAISQLPTDVPSKQIENMLPGFKQEEVAESGIRDYLATHRELIQRDDLLRRMEQTLPVPETTTRGWSEVSAQRDKVRKIGEELDRLSEHRYRLEKALRNKETPLSPSEAEAVMGTWRELRDEGLSLYTQKLKLENEMYVNKPWHGRFMQPTPTGLRPESASQEPEYNWRNVVQYFRDLGSSRGKTFVASEHFPEKNIAVFHLGSDRVLLGRDGRPETVLFVEQIQSDVHELGRDVGYFNRPASDPASVPATRQRLFEKRNTERAKIRAEEKAFFEFHDTLAQSPRTAEGDPLHGFSLLEKLGLSVKYNDPSAVLERMNRPEFWDMVNDPMKLRRGITVQVYNKKYLSHGGDTMIDVWKRGPDGNTRFSRNVGYLLKPEFDHLATLTPDERQLVKDYHTNLTNYVESQQKKRQLATRRGGQLNLQDKFPQGIVDLPYKKDWPLLGIKRALYDAAVEGKDWVAWPTGDKVADVTGGVISGQRKFYDERLVNEVNDYLRSQDLKPYGLQVQKILLPIDKATNVHQARPQNAWGIRLTPEFREHILREGQPLYTVAPPAVIGTGLLGGALADQLAYTPTPDMRTTQQEQQDQLTRFGRRAGE